MSTTAKTPRDAYLLFAGLFLSVAPNNLVTPLLPAIQHSVGMSVAGVGVYVSAYGMARLVVDLPSGVLSMRIGPRRMILIGVGLNATASAVAIFAGSAAVLLVARICAGVGAGLLATVILTAMSDIAPAEIRGRVMSLYQVANNLGIAVYPLVGGLLGLTFGWRAGFVAATVTAVGCGLVLRPVMRRISRLSAEDAAHRAPRPAEQPRAERSGAALALTLGLIFFGVTANMVNRHGFRNTVLPLVASSRLHLSGVEIATGITVMSLTGILVTIPASALGDRLGRNRIIVTGLTVLALGDFLFPAVARNYATFILAGAVIGLGDCFSSSQTAQLAALVGVRRRSMVLAAYRFFVDLGALIGPLGLAWVLDRYGMNAALRSASILLLAAAVAALIAARSRAWSTRPAHTSGKPRTTGDLTTADGGPSLTRGAG
ncbi:MAG: transporter [Frankiales bacterium]|nr:transporter [Frankiales bacterium]